LAAKERGLELFIALGVGGAPSGPDEFLIVPGHLIHPDMKIDPTRYLDCLCPKDPAAFHSYIERYFKSLLDNKNL